MATIIEQNLTFIFDPTIDAQKYDTWTHYTDVWNRPPASQKAVDIVAIQTSAAPTTTWFIEAKDFRVVDPAFPPKPSNVASLPQTMATKVLHTLGGLADAEANATVSSEKNLAVKVMTTGAKRIVLHLEPHSGAHSALFPVGFTASVLQRLRQLVATIDTNPLVLNIANTPASGVPWTVS
jgi:hypothetical protein